RIYRGRVAELAGDELPPDLGEARLSTVFGHGVLPAIDANEAHMRVRSTAGRAGKRPGHEGREEPLLAGDLLDPVLEAERPIRPRHARTGRVVDLPLRARVFAVGGDDVDPEVAHLADDAFDRRHPGVPNRVEDVIAAEQLRV